MLKVHASSRSTRSSDLILLWALADGTRCGLTSCGGVIELQLVSDDVVLRRAHFLYLRPAYETAQRWRVDHEIERGSPWQQDAPRCPECSDDGFVERLGESGPRAFCCRSCGEAWVVDEQERREQ